MELALIIAVAVVGFGVFFFLVKRVLRMALRLAVLGAILFALLAGRWRGGGTTRWAARPPIATPGRLLGDPRARCASRHHSR